MPKFHVCPECEGEGYVGTLGALTADEMHEWYDSTDEYLSAHEVSKEACAYCKGQRVVDFVALNNYDVFGEPMLSEMPSEGWAAEMSNDYIPSRSYISGFGPLDAHIEWDRDEFSGDLVLNVVTQNGEYGAGIYLNRVAIADLIADLAKCL